MNMLFHLLASESAPKRGCQGEFIYIKEATGVIALTIETADGKRSTYNVNKRDQLHFPREFVAIELENKTASMNTVELLVGYGRFMPNDEGQRVVIDGSTGSVPVDVMSGALTDAQLRATPVATTALTDAEMRAAAIAVTTDGLTNAQLRATPVAVSLVDSGAFAAPAQVTDSGTIPANPARRGVIIKSKTGNTGTIDTGATGCGLPLDAGECVTIHTTAVITITCSNHVDVWGYVEF